MENDYKNQVSSLNQEIKDLQAEKRDFETLKKQVGQQNTEYNRLADERNALERSASGQKDEPKKSIWMLPHCSLPYADSDYLTLSFFK